MSRSLEKMAKNIVQAMEATGVKRLIFYQFYGLSCKSVAHLIVKLATNPELEVRRSLGVNKPE